MNQFTSVNQDKNMLVKKGILKRDIKFQLDFKDLKDLRVKTLRIIKLVDEPKTDC